MLCSSGLLAPKDIVSNYVDIITHFHSILTNYHYITVMLCLWCCVQLSAKDKCNNVVINSNYVAIILITWT